MPSLSLPGRLAPLSERPYRLFFSASTISTLGDSVAGIALAFAVLDLTGTPKPLYLAIVFAGRQLANGALVLYGGVLSDRLPRNRILVGAAIGQGLAQAATAAVVLSDQATIGLLVGLQIVYGAADSFVIPAETGLVPQTVSDERLQEANALRGMMRNLIFVVGPAVGGVIVVAGSPGIALAIDAASFVGAALLLDPHPRRTARVANGTHPFPARAPRGLARVHLAHLAVVDRGDLRARELLLHVLVGARSDRREGAPRRGRRVGQDPGRERDRSRRRWSRRPALPPQAAAGRLRALADALLRSSSSRWLCMRRPG